MTEHSPLPWYVSGVRSRQSGTPYLSIVAGDEKTYVQVLYSDSTPELMAASHADAAFICKAVNNHDALVEALTQLRKSVAKLRSMDFPPGIVEAMLKADDALKAVQS